MRYYGTVPGSEAELTFIEAKASSYMQWLMKNQGGVDYYEASIDVRNSEVQLTSFYNHGIAQLTITIEQSDISVTSSIAHGFFDQDAKISQTPQGYQIEWRYGGTQNVMGPLGADEFEKPQELFELFQLQTGGE
jgi:hypothetical protein